MRKQKDPLWKRIQEYLQDEDIGPAMKDAADMILRLRLGQLNIVAETMKRYCSIQQEGHGVSIDEPLYKVVELGALLECYSKYGECKYAASCWITRKGFCQKRKEENKEDEPKLNAEYYKEDSIL